MSALSDLRLYGAAIALTSGIYSVVSSLGGGTGMMATSDSVMLILGVVVVGHGIALLTPMAERSGAVSGPLMIVWATLMLVNQVLPALSGSTMAARDSGMVALAVLMLASGVLMTSRRMSI